MKVKIEPVCLSFLAIHRAMHVHTISAPGVDV